jgi:hypothetical protein
MPKLLTDEEKTKRFNEEIAHRVATREAKAQKAEEKRLEWAEAQNAKRLKKDYKRHYCKWCREEFIGLNFDLEAHLKTQKHTSAEERIRREIHRAKSLLKEYEGLEEDTQLCPFKGYGLPSQLIPVSEAVSQAKDIIQHFKE